jgi:hypothetical protein
MRVSYTIKGVVLAILFAFGTFAIYAQESAVEVSGVVKHYRTGKRINAVTVVLSMNDTVINQQLTAANGKYSFRLDFDKNYHLKFVREGLVTQSFLVNTNNVGAKKQKLFYQISGGISMFEEIDQFDLSLFERPIASFVYIKKEHKFDYDPKYVKTIKPKVKKFFVDFKAEEDRRKHELEEFAQLIRSADNHYYKKRYTLAAKNYKKALYLRPSNNQLKQKYRLAIKLSEE